MINKYLKKKKYIINLLLIIIWMTFIFFMSNQPAETSDSQSLGIITMLSKMGIDMSGMFGDIANFIVRKCAHFLEYMILGFLIINLIKQDLKLKYIILIAIGGVFLYACTDEFHQLFVSGRDGNFRDIFIDTSGGTTSALLFSLKRLLIKNRINE
ncbi:VanZ family protein [Clostridium butyricum]|uniref:VanZ family protein n=1 Tax=Clostridium butyricum TaxID=1492 RepID=UPI0009037960|nr:VanZ family protein [Clostridium butyricum]APF22614.1 vanZ like family protein [Clostridium butyricum]